MDFIRGASLSESGKPIIALASKTTSGIFKFLPFLKQAVGQSQSVPMYTILPLKMESLIYMVKRLKNE
jgi:hypothetical protein